MFVRLSISISFSNSWIACSLFTFKVMYFWHFESPVKHVNASIIENKLKKEQLPLVCPWIFSTILCFPKFGDEIFSLFLQKWRHQTEPKKSYLLFCLCFEQWEQISTLLTLKITLPLWSATFAFCFIKCKSFNSPFVRGCLATLCTSRRAGKSSIQKINFSAVSLFQLKAIQHNN